MQINYNGSSKLIKCICNGINTLFSNFEITTVSSVYSEGIELATVRTPKSGTVKIYGKRDMPSGGTDKQVLQKLGDTDYSVQWGTIYEVPSGGSSGQVLKKRSSANFDTYWANESGGGGGGQPSPLFYDSNGFLCIDYDLVEERNG